MQIKLSHGLKWQIRMAFFLILLANTALTSCCSAHKLQRALTTSMLDSKTRSAQHGKPDAAYPYPSGSGRKVVLIFSGLFGQPVSFQHVTEVLTKRGFTCIAVAEQPFHGFSAHEVLDDWCLARLGRRLGLGAIASQAAHAQQRLRSQLRENDEVYLLAHSQGALVALLLWENWHTTHNFRAIAVMSAPLQGSLLVTSLSSPSLLRAAQKHNRVTGARIAYINYLLPYSITLFFEILGPFCCPGVMDMKPTSSTLSRLKGVYEKMRQAQVPFLTVVASCPTHPGLAATLFGEQGTGYLVGGGKNESYDGAVTAASQYPPIAWEQLQQVTVTASHGNGPQEGCTRVYEKKETIAKIVEFFDRTCY